MTTPSPRLIAASFQQENEKKLLAVAFKQGQKYGEHKGRIWRVALWKHTFDIHIALLTLNDLL